MKNVCRDCGNEFDLRCSCGGDRDEAGIRQEMTDKLNRMFELTVNCKKLRVNVDTAHLQFFQRDNYGISCSDTVRYVSISDESKIGTNIWGYIKTWYKNEEWCYTVLDVCENKITDNEDAAKELLILGIEVFLRTDSETGHSLKISKRDSGTYGLEIPCLEYKYANSNWFEWFD